MNEVWLVADTHFGHKNICKYRDGFNNPEEHDARIYENIVTTVRPRDTLYMLGDICFNKESLHFLRGISERVGRLHLILGNHCYSKIDDYVGIVSTIGGVISKKNFWLSHAPIHPSEIRRRHGNIYGHAHAATIDDPRYRCVSLEQTNFRPIAFRQVMNEIHEAIREATRDSDE